MRFDPDQQYSMPPEQNSDAQVYQVLVRLLATREHSRAELHRKLRQRGYDFVVIEQQLNELVEQGMQSDRRYAEMALRSGVAKGHGPNRLRQLLQQHNIDFSLAKNSDSEDPIDWFEIALTAKVKKFGDDIESDWQKRQKQQRFLQNRGFTFEQINYAVSNRPD